MVSPATSSWNVLILCETTPLIFNRTKESLLFPIPLFLLYSLSLLNQYQCYSVYIPPIHCINTLWSRKASFEWHNFHHFLQWTNHCILLVQFNIQYFHPLTHRFVPFPQHSKIIVRHTNTYTTHAGNESKIDLISRSGCVNSCKACITPPSVAKPPNVFIPKLYKYNLFSMLWFVCF